MALDQDERELLLNCCTDLVEPDWNQFSSLTIIGMVDFDGRSEIAKRGNDINFWCVFGVNKGRMIEPITDSKTLAVALYCAKRLAELSNLPIEVLPN